MADKTKKGLHAIKDKAVKAAEKINMDTVKEKAVKAGDYLGEKAADVKDAAMTAKDDIAEKLTELDRMLEESITEYNDAYTLMNDKGMGLFIERNRAVDSIAMVENLINSIANHPKAFDTEFEEINTDRTDFIGSCEFAQRELQEAREAAGRAGAGLAAGASVAFMAPTAAMWIATTFGTASTGTAISTLTGAAATNAALAWLGGGALAAGGGGMAAGNALLALAGPVGWTIAGASLLTSILLFTKKKAKLNKQKNEEIEAVKQNTERIKEVDVKLEQLLNGTKVVRTKLNDAYMQCLTMYGKDYTSFTDNQKKSLGTLVNMTKTLSAMLGKTVD